MAGQAQARGATRLVLLLGGASGGIFLVQVIVSTSAASANVASISSLQLDVFGLFSGGGADPTPELLALVPALVSTYLAAVLCGAAMVGFCWYAGRLAAWRGYGVTGGEMGTRIALLSSLLWGLASIAAVLLTHGDATITGIFSAFTVSRLGLEVGGVLLQELLFTLVGMTLGAFFGSLGAKSIRPTPPQRTLYPRWPEYPPQSEHASQPLPPR